MVPTTQRPDLSRLLIPIFQCRSPFDHTRSNQSLRPLRHLVRRSDSVATGAKADMTRMPAIRPLETQGRHSPAGEAWRLTLLRLDSRGFHDRSPKLGFRPPPGGQFRRSRSATQHAKLLVLGFHGRLTQYLGRVMTQFLHD